MQFKNVAIESMVHYVAPHVIRSADLESTIRGTMDRLGLPNGMIENLTGVKERRWFDPGVRPSQVSAAVGKKALEEAGVSASQIGVLINGSVCRDYIEPATAALVSGVLGLSKSSMHFDISNACLGFLNGMWMVANMIELGQIDYGLVVCGETARPGVSATLERLQRPNAAADEFRDNFATLTLGSGGAGAVLCRKGLARKGHTFSGATWVSDTRYSNLCRATEFEMRVDPNGLLEHGVDCAVDGWKKAETEFGWKASELTEIILHQVGKAHHQRTFERCQIPLDRGPVTFPFLGNTGPASVPITMALRQESGFISEGSKVAMFGVGSGLGSLILGVDW